MLDLGRPLVAGMMNHMIYIFYHDRGDFLEIFPENGICKKTRLDLIILDIILVNRLVYSLGLNRDRISHSHPFTVVLKSIYGLSY